MVRVRAAPRKRHLQRAAKVRIVADRSESIALAPALAVCEGNHGEGLFIHIRLPKAGSTAIQTAFADDRQNLAITTSASCKTILALFAVCSIIKGSSNGSSMGGCNARV